MSKREDILDGRVRKNWSKNYGLLYTCRAGWVDLGHLNPYNSRPEIGAGNLWKNINNEGDAYNKVKFEISRIDPRGHYIADEFDEKVPYHFPDGKTGFLVRYRQDHAGYWGKPGVERRYIVKHGLTKIQKRQVALSILMEVSISFESFQRFLSIVTDSGFSQEDLVSNLIGFYIGIGDITQEKALELCHPVSKQVALSIWDKEGSVGRNKNNKWRPKYAKSTVHISNNQCIDECLVSGTTFPEIFTKIKPVRKGFLYVNA